MPCSPELISPQLGRGAQEGSLELGDPLRLPRKCYVAFGEEPGEGVGPRLVVPERRDLAHHGRQPPVRRPTGRRQLPGVPSAQRLHLGRQASKAGLEGP